MGMRVDRSPSGTKLLYPFVVETVTLNLERQE